MPSSPETLSPPNPLLDGLRRAGIILAILVTTLVADQWTKLLVRQNIGFFYDREFVGGLFTLKHAENRGAFLSLGATLESGLRFWIFIIAVGVFLLWAAYKIITDRKMPLLQSVGLTFLLAGGLGNVIDRVERASVTDFMMINLGPVHTGVFNIADMAIIAGVVTILFVSNRTAKKPQAS